MNLKKVLEALYGFLGALLGVLVGTGCVIARSAST